LDAWHSLLIGAITTLAGTVAVLWRENRKLHAEHKQDIRSLTQAALQLGHAVTARAQLPSGSDRSPES
jgi:hypothetical protein